ncbi:MAG: AAA family ATPase [Myxococcales bacterium]|nr:AAA family ATPase [Myxococcales bacterium]
MEATAVADALESAIVGQAQARLGLLLALVAREHVYLEGPPGCGKSLLAETLARAATAKPVFVQFHRDTRSAELLGESVLLARPAAGGQRLSRELLPGALLEAEVAVLDDLSRAPGEAIGVLLPILGERRTAGLALPLETAIATAAPRGAESYGDPLEPTQLDRFAIQVRLSGAVSSDRAEEARQILERAVRTRAAEAAAAGSGLPLSAAERRALQARAAALELPASIRSALLRLAARLREASPEGEALITDRGFGIQAPRILRAHALLRGADRVAEPDLAAVGVMLACRVPESVRAALPELIDESISAPDSAQGAVPGEGADRVSGEGGAGVTTPGASVAADRIDAPIERVASRSPDTDLTSAEVAPLLEAIEGRLERGSAERGDDPGGTPRRYRRMRRLEEVFDADPIEAVQFVDGELPGMPHSYARERPSRGGTLAVLRDVSASMEGRLSRWAGEVVDGIVRTAARRRMRIGYCEFNHHAERFTADGRFFHRRYRKLRSLARSRRSEGRTNYEAPLRLALDEFRRGVGDNRHVVLLTDGVPVLGDPVVSRERREARRLGVRIHTVFLGLGECPQVLDQLSRETDGVRFRGVPAAGGRLRVQARVERSADR